MTAQHACPRRDARPCVDGHEDLGLGRHLGDVVGDGAEVRVPSSRPAGDDDEEVEVVGQKLESNLFTATGAVETGSSVSAMGPDMSIMSSA